MSEAPTTTPVKKAASPKRGPRKPAGPTQSRSIGTCPGCGVSVDAEMSFAVRVGEIDVDSLKATTDVTMTGVKIAAHICDAPNPGARGADDTVKG